MAEKGCLVQFFPAPDEGRDYFPYWKKDEVKVYDGGSWFWQIYYDPAYPKSVFKFASNGNAQPVDASLPVDRWDLLCRPLDKRLSFSMPMTPRALPASVA